MSHLEIKRRGFLDRSGKLLLGAAAGSLAAPDKVARKFARPTVYAWKDIRPFWGAREI
jgi:hypothetical protein